MKGVLICTMLLLAVGAAIAACDSGGGQQETATPSASPAPTTLATPPNAGISPPFEGPRFSAVSAQRTNYWEEPDFRLPSPEELPEPPAGASGLEFQPPAEPRCPDSWNSLSRPAEGFGICYPDPWFIEGHGYVTAGRDDRWYAVGLFLFEGSVEAAHVSVYIANPYARPPTYTRDCEQAYGVTFAGEPAVLCPNLSGVSTEARIIAYHVRRDDLDYFVSVVPHFEYDAQAGRYLDAPSGEVEATAIQIAHTFYFVEIVHP